MTSGTIVVTNNTVKLGITLSKSITQKIDNMCGDIPRSRYIHRAIEKYLSKNTANSNYNVNKSAVTKKRRK
jgi:metal-responsive CopG/Arc/MetJ family transcriptional regulator